MSRDVRVVGTGPDQTAASAPRTGHQLLPGDREPSAETRQAELLHTGRGGGPDVPRNEDIGPAGAAYDGQEALEDVTQETNTAHVELADLPE